MKGISLTAVLITFGIFALPNLVRAHCEVVADKITRGRTSDEKVYEYVIPANEWIVTSLWITTNQEVLIHHLTSYERVTLKPGALIDSKLQKADAILPLYTSRNCPTDRGANAKVRFMCVQLSKSESIKLFASNSVRV